MTSHLPNGNQSPKKKSRGLPQPTDERRRQFLVSAAGVFAGCGAVCALVPMVSSLLPNAQTRAAGGAVRVDLSTLRPGQQMTVLWRGKPVWIIRRTRAMLANLRQDNALLRDPHSAVQQQPSYAANRYRSIKPEYLVLIGLCTHLGCVPNFSPAANQQLPGGGFYCPCHGSCFDLAGRVFKHMPAPVNLAVPPYRFIHDTLLEIGESEHA